MVRSDEVWIDCDNSLGKAWIFTEELCIVLRIKRKL